MVARKIRVVATIVQLKKSTTEISWREPCRFSPCTGKIQEKELWEKILPASLNGRIILGEEAIIRKNFQSNQQWKYDKITSIQFDRATYNGKEINLMRLTILNAQEIAFGVAPKTDLNQVKKYLESKGIEIISRTL